MNRLAENDIEPMLDPADPLVRDILAAMPDALAMIAVHDDQSMQLPITIKVITEPLDDFLPFSHAVRQRAK